MVSARLVALALMASAVAAAHVEQYPQRDVLTLRPSGARLVISYAIPAGEDARTVRKAFDRDHDGTLDPGEYRALATALAEQARHFAALSVDDAAVTLRLVGTEPGPPGKDNERLVVEVTLEAKLDLTKAHRVVLEDRHKDRRIQVPITVVVEKLQLANVPQAHVSVGHPLQLDLD